MIPQFQRAARSFILLISAAAHAAEAPAEWSAGIATAKITPARPIPLEGYAHRVKPFESVDMDIDAKALALKDAQGSRAILLTVDLCVLHGEIGQLVRRRVAEKTGIEESAILLNVAHSHSAPAVKLHNKPATDGVVPVTNDETIAYTQWLCDRLVEIAGEAAAHMEPAKLSWGVGFASFAINRREFTDRGIILGHNPRGLVDRSVPVLRVDAPDGKPRVVLFGYACHNTTMPHDRLAVSGDYEGYAKQYIQEHVPGAQAMFMIGCGADANPYMRNTFERTKEYGDILGREVCRVMEAKLLPVHGPLKCAEVTAELPLQTPDRAALEAIAKDGPRLSKGPAQQMLATLDSGKPLPPVFHAPVGAWQFGQDLTLIALPDEVVAQYVPDIERAVGPLRLWISGYNQEVVGYIPSDQIIREGGYETRGLYFGTGWFALGVEEALVTAVRRAAAQAGRTVK